LADKGWWRVDLLQVEPVSEVYIVNRGDCCGYRLNNFEILVGRLAFLLILLSFTTGLRDGCSCFKSLYDRSQKINKKLTDLLRMSTKENVTELWNNELLPTIRREIKAELEPLKLDIAALVKRLDSIEASQSFLSSKYDDVLRSIANVNQKHQKLTRQVSDARQEIDRLKDDGYDLEVRLDELAQYARRDSLEITGNPIVPNDNREKLVTELAEVMGVHVKQEDISIAHRLRPTKNVKDRVIVKFIATTKREEVYKKRLALRSKTAKDLPSMTVFLSLPSSTVNQNAKIYVNESLTPYCKRLFSDILKSKREYSYKHLWTSNGKICL